MSKWAPDLYIIQSAVTGCVKIGRTKDVDARLLQLQTACPHKLRIIVHMPGEGHMERVLHRELKHYRIRWNGEWFTEDGLASLPDRIYDMIDLENQDWWQDPQYDTV